MMLVLPALLGSVHPLGSEAQEVPEWTLIEEVRIGAVDGPQALGNIGQVVVSPRSGKLFASEESTRILSFDAEGRRTGSFGREGSGPGEFRNLTGLHWFDGALVATEGRTSQVTRFSEEGDLLESRRVASGPLDEVTRSAAPVAPLENGMYLGRALREVPDGAFRRADSFLVRMDGAGHAQVLDRLAHEGVWAMMSGANLMFPIPMLPRSYFASHPYGDGLAIVHQGDAEDGEATVFRVRRLASDGSVAFVRTYTSPSERLSTSFAKNFVARYRSDFQRTGASEREAERIVSENVPRYQPPIDGVEMGSDGSIWLKQSSDAAEYVWWSVLDARGDPAGRIRLPERTRVRYIDRDFIWVIELDELDVNYLVRYGIVR